MVMVIKLKMLNDGSVYLKMQLFLFNLFTCKMSIIHGHNTGSKKQLEFESLKVDVRSTKDEFLNMKDVIIKMKQVDKMLTR